MSILMNHSWWCANQDMYIFMRVKTSATTKTFLFLWDLLIGSESATAGSDQFVSCINVNVDGSHFSPIVCLFYLFHRNVFSRRHLTKQGCVSSGMEIFASITAMRVAGDGISPSMVQSVQLQQPLMV